MQTLNTIRIEAPWRKVYAAAAEIERWPELLTHYRWVRVLSGKAPKRIVDMAAFRTGFPCRWVSLQQLYPSRKRVYYFHQRSLFTQGMVVWWILKPHGARATDITLTHDMPARGPLRTWFDQRIVGDLFVHHIAGKTLAGLKRHLEGR
jgi:hypothetical protein